MGFFRDWVVILTVAIFLCSMYLTDSVNAFGTVTISFEGEVKEININQSNAPLILHGSVGYDGISVRPVTITLAPYCDVGEATLSQYEFVFHLPDTIPFDAYIFISPETENDTMGMLTLNIIYTEGGIQYDAGSVSQIFLVLNYDENETAKAQFKMNNGYPGFLLLGIPAVIISSGIIIVLDRRKKTI